MTATVAALVLLDFAPVADDKPDLTPKQFRSASWKLIDDPTGNDADDMV